MGGTGAQYNHPSLSSKLSPAGSADDKWSLEILLAGHDMTKMTPLDSFKKSIFSNSPSQPDLGELEVGLAAPSVVNFVKSAPF